MSYLIYILIFFTFRSAEGCARRDVNDGIICVCNSTYCDVVPGLDDLTDNNLQIFYTSAIEPGFNVKKANFINQPNASAVTVTITSNRSQKILGFGGAFTDATGQNIQRLPEGAQQKLLESYFGDEGIGYNLCRVPIGGTDFSPRPYSYDDYDGDIQLQQWQLQEEDRTFKIPTIKKAQSLRGNKGVKLFATAWTAPPWMKTNAIWSRGFSLLKEENYQVWADYIKKFFDAYEDQNITFWGLTTGNEPLNGFYSDNGVNSMGWVPDNQAKWITENLGPTIRSSKHKDLKIMIHDESTIVLPFVVPTLLNNSAVLDVIDGVATHWYWDSNMAPEVKNLAKTDKKDIFLLSSEACYFQTGPLLGSWERAAGYVSSIIDYLKFGFGGWIDWNMALNSTGGFTYINVLADSPIIISEEGVEFYKQPLFYAMGHFSKFVLPDSVRLDVTQNDENLESLAFVRPDNLKVVIIFNKGTGDIDVQIKDAAKYSDNFIVPGSSILSVVYHS